MKKVVLIIGIPSETEICPAKLINFKYDISSFGLASLAHQVEYLRKN